MSLVAGVACALTEAANRLVSARPMLKYNHQSGLEITRDYAMNSSLQRSYVVSIDEETSLAECYGPLPVVRPVVFLFERIAGLVAQTTQRPTRQNVLVWRRTT